MNAAADALEADRPSSARAFVGRLRRLMRIVAPYRREIRHSIIRGVAYRVLFVASGVMVALLIGRLASGATTDELWWVFVLVAFMALPQLRLPWLQALGVTSASYRAGADIRRRIYVAFDGLAPGGLVGRRTGDLAGAALSDVAALEGFFARALGHLVTASAVPVLALAAMAAIRWQLAFVLLPFLVSVATVPWWLHRRADREGAAVRARSAALSADAVDLVQGMRETVAFCAETRAIEAFAGRSAELGTARISFAGRTGIEGAAADALASAGALCVLLAGIVLVHSGRVSPSLLPAAFVLAALSFLPIMTLHHGASELGVALAASERIFALVDAAPSVPEHASASPRDRLDPTVRFEHVSFRYATGMREAVRDVSFDMEPGQTVALVGPSGAGKSTCSHLLLRFWDPTAGAITIDGVDVRELPLETLYRLVGLVPQDVYLFNVSIAENIRLGRPLAGDEEVRRAARSALADEFVEALPDGYDTVVGERGARLSGGQRQRIAIARALLTDPPILVMDEPVSNLDSENELALRRAMATLRAGRATLVVAHRISTIRAADKIVVLERGRVVEAGTHRRLVNADGAYSRLVSSQLGREGRLDGTI